MDSNVEEKIVFKQPKLFAERQDAVKILVERLKFRMPVAIDGMDNRADAAFAAWPERIYIVGPGGRVAYKGGMGPFEFDVKDAGERLAGLLGGLPRAVLTPAAPPAVPPPAGQPPAAEPPAASPPAASPPAVSTRAGQPPVASPSAVPTRAGG
jgi:hypothetical protein